MDALETLHEGTDEVKQSKVNTLVQQYELFCMKDGETISSMQIRFTHIIDKLQNLGKTISNQDCTNKILRCMTKEWHPKVTAIKEAQNLNVLSMITLFGKLKEHEHEINRFKSSEDVSRRKERKSIALNTTSSVSTSSVQNDDEFDHDAIDEEEMSLFVRQYNRYIKRNGLKHNDKTLVNFRKASRKGRESYNDEKVVTCYSCGKIGHYKNECPELAKERGRFGANRSSKGRRAYIVWEEDKVTSNISDTENKDEDDRCFMGQTKKAKNEVIFSDSDSDSDSYSDFKPTYKDLQDSIEEMHAESLNAFEKLIAQKKTILKLESKISKLKEAFESLRDEHALLVNEKIVSPTIESPKTKSPKYDNWMDFASCKTYPSLHEEINSLNKKLERVSKGTMTCAMNSKDERVPFKRPYTKYSYVRKNNNRDKTHVPTIRCHYCGISGHATPHCHIRKVVVPKGVMMWVPKVTCCETHSKAPTCVGS